MAYQRCSRCIMDNENDATITFDEDGYCNYCRDALSRASSTYFPNKDGRRKLESLLAEIKAYGKGKKYDCVMGLSGGLDSSYLVYLGKAWGLRVLAVHIDDGYDTSVSKQNLKKLVKATGFDYQVIYPDAEQFNALTKAYIKAGVPNIAVPQDNILFAEIYRYMKRYKIKYFLSGGNYALESILSVENTHSAYDVVNIRDIHRKFGEKPINKLKFLSSTKRILNKKFYKIETYCPLNLVRYERQTALDELFSFCGFEYYGSKHLENKLTAFIQIYWFRKKFKEDKRLAHYSSMIVSEQMTRVDALRLMEEPPCDEEVLESYIADVLPKIGLTRDELESIMSKPSHKHSDYRTEDDIHLYRLLKWKTK